MIKTLTVRNYKSLRDITISFQPLTVLAGPNASGKTNILDAYRPVVVRFIGRT